MGMGMGQSRGRSKPHGDIVFFSNGQIVFTVNEVEDPSGVVRMINAARKGM